MTRNWQGAGGEGSEGLPSPNSRAWEPYTVYTSELLNQDLCRGAWALHFFQMPQVGKVTWRERQWRQEVESLHAKGSATATPGLLPTYLLRQSRLKPLRTLISSPTCLRVFVLTLLPNASLSASLCSSRYQLSEVFLTSPSLTVLPHTPSFLLTHTPPPYPHFLFLHSTYYQIIYPCLSMKFCVCMFPAKKMEASRPQRLFHSLLFPMTSRYFHVTFSAHSVFA